MAYSPNKTLRPEGLRPVERDIDMDPLLYDLLQMGFAHGHEKEFATIMPKGFITDKQCNYIYTIGKDTTTMFSSHLDTVHKGQQFIKPVMSETGYVYGIDAKDDSPSILGADDKTGVWLMLQMMAHKVPGLYVFHAGEERGGIGSNFITSTTPEIVKNIKRCIALDRKDYEHIITHQGGERCCSDEFAKALADQLNPRLPALVSFDKNTGGTFTDSANYTKLISECTNLSVGYFHQHSKNEHFDLVFLEQMLLPALCKVNWEELPEIRDKTKVTVRHNHNYGAGRQYYGGGNMHYLNNAEPKTLTLKDVENVAFNTPWPDLPAFEPTMQLEKGVPAWKISILLQKYIQYKGMSSAAHDIAKALIEEPKNNNAAAAEKRIETQVETIQKQRAEIEALKKEVKSSEDYITKYELGEMLTENISLKSENEKLTEDIIKMSNENADDDSSTIQDELTTAYNALDKIQTFVNLIEDTLSELPHYDDEDDDDDPDDGEGNIIHVH